MIREYSSGFPSGLHKKGGKNSQAWQSPDTRGSVTESGQSSATWRHDVADLFASFEVGIGRTCSFSYFCENLSWFLQRSTKSSEIFANFVVPALCSRNECENLLQNKYWYFGKSHYYVLNSNAKTILTTNIIRGPQMSNLKIFCCVKIL